MTRTYFIVFFVSSIIAGQVCHASPEEDRQAMANYYSARFPGVPFAEFSNGIYAFDENSANGTPGNGGDTSVSESTLK